MIIDFHSHILPGIDDGSKDIPMSVAILDKEIEHGIDTVIATPHYYPEEQSIKSFIQRRNDAYDSLKSEIDGKNYPDIRLGAEVYFSSMLLSMDNLHDLCIQNTDYILLELPYDELTSKILHNIEKLIYSSDISFVIAHVERYLNYTSFESIMEVMNMDVLGQVNAASLTSRGSRKDVLSFMKAGVYHVIGSDAHNTTSRPVLMKDAEKVLSKKVSKDTYHEFMHNAKMILNNVDIDNIM